MSLRETHPISMFNMKDNSIYTSLLVNKSIVYEYFKLIKDKNINRLLNLFAEDAIIHEPFSNIDGGLKGKSAMQHGQMALETDYVDEFKVKLESNWRW
jgi:hypothetical protein